MYSGQTLNQVFRHAAWVACATFACLAIAVPRGGHAATPGFEGEPTLSYSSFQGLPPQRGPDYEVATQVPVSGFYGQFTLHTKLGDLHADGASLLKQRIEEIQPAMELQELSGTKVFADALGKSAQGGAEAIGRAVAHPVDTAKNLPAGIGRFFKSVGHTVQNVATSDNGDQGAAVADAFGINKAKRQLAKKVGVDPYTTNPFVAKRLNELAQAAVAGGVSIDVALAAATGGAAMIVSATKTVSNLAWSLPPEDIRERNDKDLATLGVDAASRASLLGNRWYTPTMALFFVEAMKVLGVRDGASAFTALAAGAQSEVEARFYIAQLRMAHRFAEDGHRVVAMEPRGRIGAFRTDHDDLFVPTPLDYLTWTEGVKAVVDAPTDRNVRARTVWFTGGASPKATAELRRAGWTVRTNTRPD